MENVKQRNIMVKVLLFNVLKYDIWREKLFFPFFKYAVAEKGVIEN